MDAGQRAAEVRAAAPGRVNLIGEHTDYNGGFVLPTAIPQRTHVVLAPRPDDEVHARSANAEPTGRYVLGQEARRGDWLDYVQGVTWALQDAGHRLRGFVLDVSSEVPLGGGLSSSASLEVALLRGLRTLFGLELDDVALARLGQRAENDFVGARCGIMDQLAASLADCHTALFVDTHNLQFQRLPLPASADVLVIHSGVSHSVAAGDYNRRRAECETAARQLGVEQLRELGVADLPRIEAALPPVLARRARHVVTEDQRVLEAVDALGRGDVERLGQLFAASHASMRDDFEVSTPEIDLLVQLATDDADVYGARLTGGGFGGAVVALTRHGHGRAAGERISQRFARQSGRPARVLVPAPSA